MKDNDFSMFAEGYEPENLTTSFGTGSDMAGAGMMAKSGGNPALIAGMVGLKALEAYKARKERERMERFQAQVATTNRMQGALSKLANIGSAMKLG